MDDDDDDDDDDDVDDDDEIAFESGSPSPLKQRCGSIPRIIIIIIFVKACDKMHMLHEMNRVKENLVTSEISVYVSGKLLVFNSLRQQDFYPG